MSHPLGSGIRTGDHKDDGVIRVLVADDHEIFREGLLLVLDKAPGIEVIGEAADGAEAVELTGRLKPDVVLLDITMPRMSGLDATLEIRQRFPDVRILILTVHEDRRYLRQVLNAGASGYLVKEQSGVELRAAIEAAHRGDAYVGSSLTRQIVDTYLSAQNEPEQWDADGLSSREAEVLRLIAQGSRTAEIASLLGIAESTVKTHRQRIMDKLELRTTAELIRYAITSGLSPHTSQHGANPSLSDTDDTQSTG